MRSLFFIQIAMAVAILLLSNRASAHAMRSGYVEILEATPTSSVRLRASVRGTGFAVEAPMGCSFENHGGVLRPEPESLLAHDTLVCSAELAGRPLPVHGIGSGLDELVVLHEKAGARTTALLRGGSERFSFPDHGRSALGQYLRLGVDHIASGVDHLLFLLLLVLSLRRLRDILWAETAFTIAHTIAFALTATGTLRVASAPTEILIAFSIVLMALDCPPTTSVRPAPSARAVALLALVFGTVHGLGFAGGLREIGLPEGDVARALVGFASGVEIGQVAFILGVFLLGSLVARWHSHRASRVLALAKEGLVVLAGGYASILVISCVLTILRS